MKLRKMVLSVLLVASGWSLLAGVPQAESPRPPLYVLSVTGAIDPAVKQYIHSGFEKAEQAAAQAVLIRLDTPGGLLDATRDIIRDFLNAPFPVVVYVSPRGARAASAGVFLTIASDVAAMTPETHLGAAHPVSIGGGLPGGPAENEKSPTVMEEKAVSDTAAYARTLATSKGRNADWAERAVRESVSLTAEEALKANVIEIVAKDEADLLAQLSGREVKKGDQVLTLSLEGAERIDFRMSRVQGFLHALANPNLAYILLILGFYALIYEFASPGIGLGAIVGVISLLLAFFALQILPLSYVGLGLLLTGVALMAADLVVPTHGLLTAGGVVCFALGSFLLFDSPTAYFRVSLELIGGAVLATAGFFLFAVKKVLESRHMKPISGRDALVGEVGEARAENMVYVHGEYWTAESSQPLLPGDKVRVLGSSGNCLRVEKV